MANDRATMSKTDQPIRCIVWSASATSPSYSAQDTRCTSGEKRLGEDLAKSWWGRWRNSAKLHCAMLRTGLKRVRPQQNFSSKTCTENFSPMKTEVDPNQHACNTRFTVRPSARIVAALSRNWVFPKDCTAGWIVTDTCRWHLTVQVNCCSRKLLTQILFILLWMEELSYWPEKKSTQDFPLETWKKQKTHC